MKSDVCHFNGLAEKQTDDVFECQVVGEGNVLEVFPVGPPPDNRQEVRIVVCLRSIHVSMNKKSLFHVTQEWNADTLECDLKVYGEPRSLWQISQMAIGDMLFGAGNPGPGSVPVYFLDGLW